MNTTLLIMAAGIGSRFGKGIKQLEPVDDAGHIIMDYSIHDAIEAGFNHVVFIVRKDIEQEFKEVIGERIKAICSAHDVTVDYAFQDINDIPGTLPEGRTKPWGTGQAVLVAKELLKTPFIVINADDYYGKEGFKAVHEYLVNGGKFCMAGFVLKNTLSDNGGVTRGICKMDEQNNLTEVVETKNIVKTADGAEADGKVIDVDSLVSMNMWGLTPDFLGVLEEGFKEFFEKEVPGNPMKAGNKEFEKDTEKKGLGTPATRAAILEKLVSSGYVERKGKQILPSAEGVTAIANIPDYLKSASMTAEWENELLRMERGETKPADFMQGIGGLLERMLADLRQIPTVQESPIYNKVSIGNCPVCGKPVCEGKLNFYCSDRDCKFALWKESKYLSGMKKTLTKKMATDLLKKGRTYAKDFYSAKKDKTFAADLVMAIENGRAQYSLEFPKTPAKK